MTKSLEARIREELDWMREHEDPEVRDLAHVFETIAKEVETLVQYTRALEDK